MFRSSSEFFLKVLLVDLLHKHVFLKILEEKTKIGLNILSAFKKCLGTNLKDWNLFRFYFLQRKRSQTPIDKKMKRSQSESDTLEWVPCTFLGFLILVQHMVLCSLCIFYFIQGLPWKDAYRCFSKESLATIILIFLFHLSSGNDWMKKWVRGYKCVCSCVHICS